MTLSSPSTAFITPLIPAPHIPAPHIRPSITMSTTPYFSSLSHIEWLPPLCVRGKVQPGFGRGSRDLGCPTANLPGSLLSNHPHKDGVYIGFARVPKLGNVVKMVANLGHNITYDDVKQRVLEAYLFAHYPDFYDEELRLCIIGYLRPEFRFASVEQLVQHINNDIAIADKALDLDNALPFRSHPTLLD